MVREARAQRQAKSPVRMSSAERDISPWLGVDPETAKKLAEAFPAPNPDTVIVRKLRKIYRDYKKSGEVVTAVFLGLPDEVLATCGWRAGDRLLVSVWAEGIIRLVRLPSVGEP